MPPPLHAFPSRACCHLGNRFRDQEAPCGATGRTGRTGRSGEPVEGVEVMPPLSHFWKIARGLPCRAVAEGASMTGPESLPTEFGEPCRALPASLANFCKEILTCRWPQKKSRKWLCRLWSSFDRIAPGPVHSSALGSAARTVFALHVAAKASRELAASLPRGRLVLL